MPAIARTSRIPLHSDQVPGSLVNGTNGDWLKRRRLRENRLSLNRRLCLPHCDHCLRSRERIFPNLKRSPVRTARDLDPDTAPRFAFSHIVLCQALPDFSSSGANDGIVSSVVIGGPAKNFRADHTFAKHIPLVVQGVLHDVLQQCPTLLARAKGRGRGAPLPELPRSNGYQFRPSNSALSLLGVLPFMHSFTAKT